MSTVVVHRVNTPRGLVATVHHARHFLSRLRGPLGSKQLAEDGGSLITPCSRVHTLGMCTPLDIVFLDANGAVMKCVANVVPFRVATARGAKHTLELVAGRVGQLNLRQGDQLRWETGTIFPHIGVFGRLFGTTKPLSLCLVNGKKNLRQQLFD